ncbi:acyltransferase [Shewanella oneidensis MR-1]|uniref:Phospholipid/glycerol acyltransferase family protein n=1 Tax=Shewanella oneidensis (strain ATCC 700550 / JCM 31522 / CIP 106686 / LMG 19005 / NCIMB 14063 / MR-1) TaxID=211586 RepID=Q8EJV9_SHEON|nr:acyltransferase [Shewanella oneidensis]AAN53432.2 phospholipid/glycerol acyltransferase family protein [Shewanella oneidensis MR-1]MDX5997701.1 acyltransferase [Shewanella oneidensis]MEE2027041.1 putative acyltransferase YihG [Shewanella oneidensis]QKG95281.1 acyltransferase [Shewanella oneidensis MR-1]
MLNFLPGPVLFMLSLSLLIINTALWGSLVCLGGLVKMLMPVQSARNAVTALMNRFMWAWATCNGGILYLIAKIEWDVEGLESLNQNSWYLLISNHLSGFDIAAQTYLLRNHIPMLKFFLKKELIYVPIMGLGCWALDMPFMDRTSPAKLKKNPKLKGKDLATTRRACEKFKNMPTSIINYVEGSRFTEDKRQRQDSPYRHLLRPKAGGIAFTLSAMGEQFTNLLDVTLVYPDAPDDVLFGVMNGKVRKIIVRVRALPVPQVDATRYFSESEYRVDFQRWLNQVWAEKDEQITELLAQHQQLTDSATSARTQAH